MSELLHCPFCNGEARHYAPGPSNHRVECTECNAVTGVCTSEKRAIEAWNRRAERTCKVVGVRYDETWDEYCIDLSCGCQLWRDDDDPPSYCEECGAKILEAVKP